METEQRAEVLSPEQLAEIAKRESQPLIVQAINLKIKNDTDLKSAAEMLAQVKKIAKNVKAQKDPIVKAMNESLKQVRGLFAPTEQGLSDAEVAIKSAILQYTEKQEAKAAKKAERIEAKVDAGEMSLKAGMNKLSKVKQAETNVETDSGSANIRTVKKVRIVDVSQLPTSYFLRDSVLEAIRKEVSNDVLRKRWTCQAAPSCTKKRRLLGGLASGKPY